MYYYPFETQVTPLISVRRERMLPAPGETLARIGDRVEPTQVVGQCNIQGDFHVISIARELGVKRSKVKKYLTVKKGERVRRNQVIAKKAFAQPVKSPIDGILTASGRGRVLIEAPPTPYELRAYVQGTVTNVLSGRGVVIETTGSVVQGVWGTGKENFGVLKRVVKNREKTLRARDVDPSCHGSIVIGGADLNEATLERAQELQIRGIVTGGLPAELLGMARRAPFPILVTEGIGSIPMSVPIFQLLSTNDGREASISGKMKTRWGVVRPEIVIPLPAESLPDSPVQPGMPLTIGARIRVIRAPYLGQTGTVISISEHPIAIETGDKVPGAVVDLGEEEPVVVPLANLEVLI